MQPKAFAAYANPALLGFPVDHASTSMGVMKPVAQQKGPIPMRISNPGFALTLMRGSIDSSGSKAQPPAATAVIAMTASACFASVWRRQILYPRDPNATAPK